MRSLQSSQHSGGRIHAQATRIKKQIPYDLGAALATLPPGQRRAVQALIGGDGARTYPEAARHAAMSLGTVLTHINRVRERHPRLYEMVRAVRLAQLAERHAEALQNAQAHSRRYFRKRAARRYFERFGRWPWDRRRFSGLGNTQGSTQGLIGGVPRRGTGQGEGKL